MSERSPTRIEFSGPTRENLHLYGSILGIDRNELASRYDAIVENAGIADFMDTAVEYHSTGMRMRLGFAVATAGEPQVLLLDEIPVVGDAVFRERCSTRRPQLG